MIDDINLLNLNSINALLKVIEEPNDNINFILINSNKRVLPTLKSRCINFKISLSQNQTIKIANMIINQDIYDIFNEELIDYYKGNSLKWFLLFNQSLSLTFHKKYYAVVSKFLISIASLDFSTNGSLLLIFSHT